MTSHILERSWSLASGRIDAVASRIETTLHGLLRVGCAMCFVGHGAWGVITKAGWLPFYAVFHIPPDIAWKTMPVVGAMDITLGLVALFRPCRALLLYLVGWTVFTALLRPLASMGGWEFLERGGNYGPPLAFFLIASDGRSGWFERIEARPIGLPLLERLSLVLRTAIAFLLVGHGGFELVKEKAVFVSHWRVLGIDANQTFLHAVGALEIAAAIAVFFKPSRPLLLAVVYWKVVTELLYPLSGNLRDGWEWVERGGDYVAPLALLAVLVLLQRTQELPGAPSHVRPGGALGGGQP